MDEIIELTLEGLQEKTRKTNESSPRVAVYDVIAMVKRCDNNYAGQIYMRLMKAGKVPECEEVEQELVPASCMNQDSSIWGGNRKPVRVASASEMVQILMQLPGATIFKQNCADVIARYLGGDTSLVADLVTNRAAQELMADKEPDHPMRIFGEEVEARGTPRGFEDMIASAIERGIRQGLERAGEILQLGQTDTNKRLNVIEEQLRKIPEYGPRIEISRGFPVKPNALEDIGIKLEAAEDTQRFAEFGLPTSTFLQEMLPDENVTRVNACFSKLLKKRRIGLFCKKPEENKIYLVYNQGAWRIAYFEDDRELMEQVLAEPAMKETIKRQFGEPNQDQDSKRRPTLDKWCAQHPPGASGSSCDNAPR